MGRDRWARVHPYLGDHLVLEHLLLVEDLDGDILAGVDVPGELDLAEGALPEGPAQLVPPHPGLPHGHAHLPIFPRPVAARRRRRRRAEKTAPSRAPRVDEWIRGRTRLEA